VIEKNVPITQNINLGCVGDWEEVGDCHQEITLISLPVMIVQGKHVNNDE
jgi:hypothetical protein